MSPVFRHGRLRLYLLKLLDESPRHGYEVIRLLQDRFMGVYAPSPGTIYPRLARLEEEGLVTHDETDGRKVYRITDRGREELNARLDDLAELEEEITASVRDIAREVSEDVRETVRSLREELASAARDVHGRDRPPGGGEPWRDWDVASSAQWEAKRAKAEGKRAKAEGKRAKADAKRDRARDTWAEAADEAWEEAGPTGEEAGQARGRGGRGWGDWPGWTGGQGWGGWPGAGGPQGQPGYRDLERLARQFAREVRMAAWHAQAVSEDALTDLREILDETLDRIKTEVFTGPAAPRQPGDPAAGPPPGPPSGPGTGGRPGTGPAGAGPAAGPASGGGPKEHTGSAGQGSAAAPDAGGEGTT
jgi:DNA-binding PadR family transcriptional regulator